ncbi:MAG TPA: hypothetical protein PKJ62_05710 [Bacteroidia bacterium]|nr:hypothetical protein [Bacteroidia bacterium]
MEIVHNSYQEKKSESPFNISYGEKSIHQVLQNPERSLLEQMGSVFSVIHGGGYKKRRSNILA